MHVHELQANVVKVGTDVWGAENATNPQERLFRMAEEFIELLRAAGLSWNQLGMISTREYFDKPVGELEQEVGGATSTLLAFANSRGIDVEEQVLLDLSNLLENKEAARAKHAAKPASMRAA